MVITNYAATWGSTSSSTSGTITLAPHIPTVDYGTLVTYDCLGSIQK